MKKDCHQHILLPQLLRRLTILTTNTMTPPSLRRLYPALPWSPKFVEQCIVDLSMSELSGFADVLSYCQLVFKIVAKQKGAVENSQVSHGKTRWHKT